MGKYKDLVMSARKAGITSENDMWKAIDSVDALLEQIKDSHPEIYWEYIRTAHTSLHGPHYDEPFAKYDVSNLTYTDKEGLLHHGAHWTPEEIYNATSNLSMPEGTTDWDEYVAFNAMYADLCRSTLTDAQILEAAYYFFFMDEDWCDEDDTSSGKVWYYMQSKS